MHTFKYSETREKGTYKPAIMANNRLSAIIICPDCGGKLALHPHTVEIDGRVVPSVVCRPPCHFHDYVTLEGWVTSEDKNKETP